MTDGTRPADNRTALVRATATGRIAPVRLHHDTLAVDRDGRSFLWPGTGGISLGVHAGDPVDRWLADHLMVGASLEAEEDNVAAVGALHLLACVGNIVRDAHGRAIGVIAGKRGGLAPGFLPPSLLAAEVTDAAANGLVPGQRVVVETVGRGLALTDRPEIKLANLSPAALDRLPLAVTPSGIAIGVRQVVPPYRAAAGLGTDAWIGDLEIISASGHADRRLCFGDLVAFDAIDSRFGRFYRPGFVSIGIVAHGPSPAPGHGVGITILLSGPAAMIALNSDDQASVGPLLRQMAEDLVSEAGQNPTMP